MRKIYFAAAALLLTINCVLAQETLSFNVHYSPEKQYRQNTEQTFEMKMDFGGDEQMLAELEEAGTELSSNENSTSSKQIDIVTGKLKSNDTFPFKMLFVNSYESDGSASMPNGSEFTGDCTIDGVPKLKKISAKGISKEFRKGVLDVAQSLLSQVVFPKAELKVGESFKQEMPLSIPIGDASMEMLLTTDYKLISITGETANFDLVQTYIFSGKISEYEFAMDGAGSGTMTYSIQHNFPTKTVTDSHLKMNMKIEDVDLKMEMKTVYSLDVAVTDLGRGPK